jgi:predicted SnoaL-like aldol condensation-catalyzing enzyme
MKKTIALIALTGLIFVSCKKEATPETTSPEIPKTANGYSLPTSENIDLQKKCNAAWEAGNVAEYKSYYAEDAVFHDNNKQTTLAENVAFNTEFLKSGIKPTIKYDVIWEEVNYEANEKGVKNYVLAYCTNTWTKGDKSIQVVTFQVDAIKDGKIVEEWNVYDSAAFEVFK